MIRVCTFVVGCLAVLAGSAYGQDAACDPAFQNVLDQRALLQGTQDLEMAQTLIYKPDSVLEYSCFAQNVMLLEQQAKVLFSDNVTSPTLFLGQSFSPQGEATQPTFASPPGPLGMPGEPQVNYAAPTPLDQSTFAALYNTVRLPGATYLTGGFAPTMGGGRMGSLPATCETMALVWQFAKCSNFEKDNFRMLGDMAGKDLRQMPLPCTDAARAGLIQAALKASAPPPADPPKGGGAQSMRTFIDVLEAPEGASSCAAMPPIPTGVGDEKLCITPGCRAVGNSCVPME
ncbi:MAG: hypothetical protein L6Q57_07045 [Alphaproteobacteria bacterium]|nr:hypothetical protein [Alphaproteobacteria bacterium]